MAAVLKITNSEILEQRKGRSYRKDYIFDHLNEWFRLELEAYGLNPSTFDLLLLQIVKILDDNKSQNIYRNTTKHLCKKVFGKLLTKHKYNKLLKALHFLQHIQLLNIIRPNNKKSRTYYVFKHTQYSNLVQSIEGGSDRVSQDLIEKALENQKKISMLWSISDQTYKPYKGSINNNNNNVYGDAPKSLPVEVMSMNEKDEKDEKIENWCKSNNEHPKNAKVWINKHGYQAVLDGIEYFEDCKLKYPINNPGGWMAKNLENKHYEKHIKHKRRASSSLTLAVPVLLEKINRTPEQVELGRSVLQECKNMVKEGAKKRQEDVQAQRVCSEKRKSRLFNSGQPIQDLTVRESGATPLLKGTRSFYEIVKGPS